MKVRIVESGNTQTVVLSQSPSFLDSTISLALKQLCVESTQNLGSIKSVEVGVESERVKVLGLLRGAKGDKGDVGEKGETGERGSIGSIVDVSVEYLITRPEADSDFDTA